MRHLDFIAQFTSDIQYIKGAAKSAADTLSRLELDHLREPAVPGVNFQALAETQVNDILHPDSTTTSLHLQEIPIPATTTTLLCDVSTRTPRPYVPPGSGGWFLTAYIFCHILASEPHSGSKP